MKRTRKWSFVEQEAKRLAGIGLTPLDIARRLGVNKSTVNRWMSTGKLDRRTRAHVPRTGQSPDQWAATVRKDYALDATDEQLVTIAESALAISLDPSLAAHVRMNAAGRFQAIVRQLSLVARLADADADAPKTKGRAEPAKVDPPAPRRTGSDPRNILQAVK